MSHLFAWSLWKPWNKIEKRGFSQARHYVRSETLKCDVRAANSVDCYSVCMRSGGEKERRLYWPRGIRRKNSNSEQLSRKKKKEKTDGARNSNSVLLQVTRARREIMTLVFLWRLPSGLRYVFDSWKHNLLSIILSCNNHDTLSHFLSDWEQDNRKLLSYFRFFICPPSASDWPHFPRQHNMREEQSKPSPPPRVT